MAKKVTLFETSDKTKASDYLKRLKKAKIRSGIEKSKGIFDSKTYFSVYIIK